MADAPVAYFLTFRAYGTWLPGDPRGSVGWRQNAPGSPPLDPDNSLERRSRLRLKGSPVYFDTIRREAIGDAVRDVCATRGWVLFALSVRTNHVHLVVQCNIRPERAMIDFKAYATRKMVSAGVFPAGGRPWSRHGSTRYLWNDDEVEDACQYVVHGQGEDLGPRGAG